MSVSFFSFSVINRSLCAVRPWSFYVQLRRKQADLDDLMAEMDEFYCDPVTADLAIKRIRRDMLGQTLFFS